MTYGSWSWWDIFSIIFFPPVVGQIIGVILIALFAFFDQICCYCCECWRGEEEIVVYDPDNPSANLVIRNGEVEDMDQRDETAETEDDESKVWERGFLNLLSIYPFVFSIEVDILIQHNKSISLFSTFT